MNELIDEAFSVRGAQYLSFNSRGKCNERKYDTNIDKSELIDMINYLVDNMYVLVGNKIFRQRIGIPMGTDCAPIYLSHGHIPEDQNLARKIVLESQHYEMIDNILHHEDPNQPGQ